MVDMSKSLASFHLSSGGQIPNTNSSQSEKFLRNKTAMDESVDHLFKEGESVAPQEGSSKGKYYIFFLSFSIVQCFFLFSLFYVPSTCFPIIQTTDTVVLP